jgi:cytochrome c peroxidase
MFFDCAPSIRRHRFALVLTCLLSATACEQGADVADLRTMALTPLDLPPSPTNAHADDPAAAALGRKLFFDKRLSIDGTIACASCHSPDASFSDPRPFSLGVRGQAGSRHAMPVVAVALQPFTLWDGRADSVWSQPIQAIENEREMDFTRTELARVVASHYKADYEALFGALPKLEQAPKRAKPGLTTWDALTSLQQTDVGRVAANVGKAIEAYERTLLCDATRFDRWARGELSFTAAESRGAQAFVEHGCTNCHSGKAFSDGSFHNVGVPSSDRGRVLGRAALLADPFNGLGPYSDNVAAGQAKLAQVQAEAGGEGAFRTPTLRGVGQRTFFGHAAHQQTLSGFIRDIYRRGGRGDRNGDGGGETSGDLDPLLARVNVPEREIDDLVAFLRTLDCPPVPSSAVVP